MSRILPATVLAGVLALSALPSGAVTFTPDLGGGSGTLTNLGTGGTVDFFATLGSSSTGTDVTTAAIGPSFMGPVQVTGRFGYFTTDVDGPGFDPFGYFIGPDLVQLTDNAGPLFQNGNFTFVLPANSVWGFYIKSLAGDFGTAVASFAGVVTPIAVVPLPAGLVLLLSALGGLGIARALTTSRIG